jgi:hypothetical protein
MAHETWGLLKFTLYEGSAVATVYKTLMLTPRWIKGGIMVAAELLDVVDRV